MATEIIAAFKIGPSNVTNFSNLKKRANHKDIIQIEISLDTAMICFATLGKLNTETDILE